MSRPRLHIWHIPDTDRWQYAVMDGWRLLTAGDARAWPQTLAVGLAALDQKTAHAATSA